jgi:predicted transcriptional regulator
MTVELEKAGLNRYQKIITLASKPPEYCEDGEEIANVAEQILKSNHRSITVVSSGMQLIGVITIMDVLNFFLREGPPSESIATIMSRDVLFCDANDTIGFALQKFKISRRGRFPITEKKTLVAVVTEHDIVKNFSNVDFETTVQEVMTAKPFFIRSRFTIIDCLKSIVNTRYRRLPIINDDESVSIISAEDILKKFAEVGYNKSKLMDSVDTISIKKVFSVSKDDDISLAVKMMSDNDVGGLPVIDNKKLVGFITERDVLEEII